MDINGEIERLSNHKEQLIEKLREIEQARPQIVAEINFIDGQLQMLERFKPAEATKE